MQIQAMTQIQTENPAAYFNTRPRLVFQLKNEK